MEIQLKACLDKAVISKAGRALKTATVPEASSHSTPRNRVDSRLASLAPEKGAGREEEMERFSCCQGHLGDRTAKLLGLNVCERIKKKKTCGESHPGTK